MSAPCCAHTLAGTSMHSAHKRSNTTQNTTHNNQHTTRSHSCRLHQNAECTRTHNNTTYPHPQEHNFALSTNTQQSYKDASSTSDCYSYDSISSTNKQPTLKKNQFCSQSVQVPFLSVGRSQSMLAQTHYTIQSHRCCIDVYYIGINQQLWNFSSSP